MWFAADLALLLLIAVLGYFSMKKGFLKSSYGGISGFAALILVFSFHAPFQAYLENSYIGETVRDKIRLSVSNAVSENPETDMQDDDDSTTHIIDSLMLPEFMSSWISDTLKNQKNSFADFKTDLTDGITDIIFPIVMQTLSALFLYLIVRIGLWILFCILKLVIEIPLFGKADRLLGALTGGINALLIIYIAAALVMLLVPSNSTQNVEAGINSTFLFKYFYYNNLITNLFF